MIKVALTNDILKKITVLDSNRFLLSTIELPVITRNRLRKNSKRRSSYTSNNEEEILKLLKTSPHNPTPSSPRRRIRKLQVIPACNPIHIESLPDDKQRRKRLHLHCCHIHCLLYTSIFDFRIY